MQIPLNLREKYKSNLDEYEKRETLEWKFVKLIDILEAEFQCIFYKDLRWNWTKEYYIEKREKHFKSFPELKYIFYETLNFFEKNNYFKQN